MIVKYLDDPAKWPVLADRLRIAGEFGYDVESYGQGYKESPTHRARIHCWSVGVLTSTRTPFGYRQANGVVLPRAALDNDAIRAVLADRSVRKWAHNAPHDYHCTVNEGIEINGIEDTLQWARVAFPGVSGYGLKSISQWALKHPRRPGFKEMVSYRKSVVVAKCKVEKGCVCSGPGESCRKRKGEAITPWGVWMPHLKVSWRKFSVTTKIVDAKYDVRDFQWGAKLEPLEWEGKQYDRWDEWIKYSAEDSIQCIELVDYIRNYKYQGKVYPWPQ